MADTYYIGRLADPATIDDAARVKMLGACKIVAQSSVRIVAEIDEHQGLVLVQNRGAIERLVGPGWAVWHIDRRTAFRTFDDATQAARIKMRTLPGMDADGDQVYETWSAFTWNSEPTALEIATARGIVIDLCARLAERPRKPK